MFVLNEFDLRQHQQREVIKECNGVCVDFPVRRFFSVIIDAFDLSIVPRLRLKAVARGGPAGRDARCGAAITTT